jgi:23S rRNA (adenine2503-C2)-methyltransferase
MEKRNIKNLSLEELSEALNGLGEKRHRMTQILKWLYQKGTSSFSEMTNIPLDLRRRLDESFTITVLRLADSVRSQEDSSQKFLLECDDGARVETVLMEARGHQTVCLSSQVGCTLGCVLCRTGEGGFERNLRTDEILNQVLFYKGGLLKPRRRFNIVFMGMGEPLLNYESLVAAIEILNAEAAFALGEKRITVSTIGIPDRILELARARCKLSLAVSLNATTDEVRRRLMPRAERIDETLAAARAFAEARRARATIEYVLIGGVNDTDDDARRLSELTAGRPFKLNLIPFNEWDGCDLRRPSEERLEAFIKILLPHAPAVTVRRSQGRDISAACGQLRARAGTRRP